MAINEKTLVNYPKPVLYNQAKEILDQMEKTVCKININGEKGTGFFCKIKVDDNSLIPVLITNNHLINEEFINNNTEIEIDIGRDDIYNSKIINLKNKVIFTNEE